MGFAVVASAGAGAAAAGAATARPEGLATRVGRAGGATGVVAMTWISGRPTELGFAPCCAAAPKGIIEQTRWRQESAAAVADGSIGPTERTELHLHAFARDPRLRANFAISRRMCVRESLPIDPGTF